MYPRCIVHVDDCDFRVDLIPLGMSENSEEVVLSEEEMPKVSYAEGWGILMAGELNRAEIVPNGRGELQ
ncbi:hypothetical protein Nepgr_013574 [Nepenthes gracilis]|uniref:Uncharacterized protein n=1 Tax=Nepenthes gracilis TaxID=150966 RepID=A0AAD3SI41_NEPGR|nr:hypothetical protein Nepgr_013574 [Nepenthes gracilis]